MQDHKITLSEIDEGIFCARIVGNVRDNSRSLITYMDANSEMQS